MTNSIIKNNKWVLIDVKDKILGRVATQIVSILTGKMHVDHNYDYNNITGYGVIVINSNYIRVTGNKFNNKVYYRHSGYPGGLKKSKFKDLILLNSSFILSNAVKGMLPKNKLKKIFLKRLKIYSDSSYPHAAQTPLILDL